MTPTPSRLLSATQFDALDALVSGPKRLTWMIGNAHRSATISCLERGGFVKRTRTYSGPHAARECLHITTAGVVAWTRVANGGLVQVVEDVDPCPKGDPGCETGDDGSCHDACEATR